MAVVGTLLRVLLGYLAAVLAAGLVLVGFVVTPLDLVGLAGEALRERLGMAGLLALAAATHAAIFASPFALLAVLVGEWQRFREAGYYGVVGIAIGLAGFFAQHASEPEGSPTIVNSYAFAAYVTAGLVGGLVYWRISGRYGRRAGVRTIAAGGLAPTLGA